MTLQEVTTKLSTIRKGTITKVHYVTTKGDYTKETQTRVRFVEYGNIAGVTVAGKPNPNEQRTTCDFVVYNKNTNKHYLQMATIKTKGKAQVKYYYQGQEITKEQYDMANPPRPSSQPLVVFRKDINDIISIG